jgi:hypothetical protein
VAADPLGRAAAGGGAFEAVSELHAATITNNNVGRMT